MKTSTSIFYEIEHGNGIVNGKTDNKFETAEQAIKEANEFKNDPKSHNENMDSESVEYWKRQTFVVVKKTITREAVEII